MDWARVKTILIIVFLIVNAFLVAKIMEKSSATQLKSDEIIEVEKLLQQNNIKLQTEIPSKMPAMPRIKVINRAADGDVIANKIIGMNLWNKKVETNGEVTYSAEARHLKVYKNGQIEYVVTENPDKLKLLTNKEAAENRIYDLLAAYYPLDSYRLELTDATTNGYHVKLCSYNKTYEVFNNAVEASIDFTSQRITIKQGIIDFEGYNGKAKKVSVVDALVELIRHIDIKNQISIKKISLGYYADVNKNNEIIKYGEADPAWKIETDKGDYIFDGYSGNLIKNEK